MKTLFANMFEIGSSKLGPSGRSVYLWLRISSIEKFLVYVEYFHRLASVFQRSLAFTGLFLKNSRRYVSS